MLKIIKSKPFRWALVVFWLIFIFTMSHLDVAKSWMLTGRVMVAIEKNTVGTEVNTGGMTENEEISYYSKSENERVMILLRKTAHVIEFMGLSMSLIYALMRTHLVSKSMLLSFLISVGYAAFDEAHQLLISGRTANIRDVGIDSIGVVLGIILVRIILEVLSKRKGTLAYEN